MGSRAQPKDYDVDEEEEERCMNADSIAAFAQPLQRKEKKDMELSRYKDMVSGDDPASTYDPHKSRKLKITDMRPLSVPSPHLTTTSVNTLLAEDGQSLATHQREIVSEKATFIKNPATEERISFNASPPLSVSSSRFNGLGTRQASSSLESEIDEENHARLQTMSPEEIAEAQADLLDKMDPAILSILKKRGQDKLKKRKHSLPGGSIANEETNNSRTEGHFVTPDLHSRQGQAVTPSAFQVMAIPKETSEVQNSALAQGFLWDTWTERVEAARDLRFSFDGNVVEDDVDAAAQTGELNDTAEAYDNLWVLTH